MFRPCCPLLPSTKAKGAFCPLPIEWGKKKISRLSPQKLTRKEREAKRKSVRFAIASSLLSLRTRRWRARFLARSRVHSTPHTRVHSHRRGVNQGSGEAPSIASRVRSKGWTHQEEEEEKNINRARREFISFLTTNPTRSSEDVCATPTTLGFFFLFVRAHHLADTATYAKDAGVPIKRVILHQREDDERRREPWV